MPELETVQLFNLHGLFAGKANIPRYDEKLPIIKVNGKIYQRIEHGYHELRITEGVFIKDSNKQIAS